MHFAGSSFGSHLLLNTRINSDENIKSTRLSTLITMEPCFLIIFQTTHIDFNLSPDTLNVYCPKLVMNALKIDPGSRNFDTIRTIVPLLNAHFSTSSTSKIEKLAKSIKITNHKQNEVVFYQGDRADM
jgi:hypothetical protein